MRGEDSGRIKDDFQASALNSECRVMTMSRGRRRGQAWGIQIWKFKKKTERPILDL